MKYLHGMCGFKSYYLCVLKSCDLSCAGHVIYYMCTGGDMKIEKQITVLPSEENLSAVTDERCRELLKYIFKMKNNKIKNSIKEISQWPLASPPY